MCEIRKNGIIPAAKCSVLYGLVATIPYMEP